MSYPVPQNMIPSLEELRDWLVGETDGATDGNHARDSQIYFFIVTVEEAIRTRDKLASIEWERCKAAALKQVEQS